MTAGAQPREPGFAANAAYSVVGWFVSALAGFICIPIVVRGLGADAYGLLTLVSAFTGYLGLMEMGLGTAIIRYIAYYRELGYGATVVSMTRVVVAWFAAAGIVGAILLYVLAPWLVRDVLKVPADLQATGVTVFHLSAFNFFLGMLISVTSTILPAFLRFDLFALVTGIMGTLASVGPAILASTGYGLVAIVVFSISLSAAGLAAYVFFVVRLYRGLNRDQGPPWRTVRRQVLSFAGVTALTRVHAVIAEQTNRIVVGAAGGTASAAYYQVPSILSANVNAMLTRIAQVLFPTASRLYAQNDQEALRSLYYRTSRLFFLAIAPVTMGMCIFAYPLIRYWVSPEFADKGSLALIIFGVAQLVNATTMSASYFNLSAARPWTNFSFSLANSAINLAVVYPLTVRYGVPGAAAAGLLGAITVPFFFVFTHRRVLRVPSLFVLRRCYLPTIAGLVVVGAAAYFVLVPLATNLLSTIALWGLTALLGVLLSGVMGAVSPEDRATGRRFISAMRAKVTRR
jgi:O-antigen/teichoic acid export membrane protein